MRHKSSYSTFCADDGVERAQGCMRQGGWGGRTRSAAAQEICAGALPEVTPSVRGLPQRHAAVMRDVIRDVIRGVIRDVIRDVIGRRKGGARSGQRVLIHTHTHRWGRRC